MSFDSSLPDPVTEPEKTREFMLRQQIRIQELEDKVETLTRQLEELIDKQNSSSRNSSKSPSMDSPEQRSQRPKRKPSSRNQGGQPGHPHHQRALYPPEHVNQIEQFFPEAGCACGGQMAIDWDNPLRHVSVHDMNQ